MNEPRAVKLEFDAVTMRVYMDNDRVLNVPLSSFPRLQNASSAQLADYLISAVGLHWDALDEDISVAHLLMGYGDRNAKIVATE
jgi:Ni,Fe-hydrogenase III component G